MSFSMPPPRQLDIGTRSSSGIPHCLLPSLLLAIALTPSTLGIRIFGCWSHHSMLLLQEPGWHLRQKATKLRAELSRPFSLLSFPYWAKNCESNWMMASVQLDQRSLQRKSFAIVQWRDGAGRAFWNFFLRCLTTCRLNYRETQNMFLMGCRKSVAGKSLVTTLTHHSLLATIDRHSPTQRRGTKQKREPESSTGWVWLLWGWLSNQQELPFLPIWEQIPDVCGVKKAMEGPVWIKLCSRQLWFLVGQGRL